MSSAPPFRETLDQSWLCSWILAGVYYRAVHLLHDGSGHLSVGECCVLQSQFALGKLFWSSVWYVYFTPKPEVEKLTEILGLFLFVRLV